jgi:hypothetical protein
MTTFPCIVDGHAITLRIVQEKDGYDVELSTKQPVSDGTWNTVWTGRPAKRLPTPIDAARHGKYILMGIATVRPTGEPVLGVV